LIFVYIACLVLADSGILVNGCFGCVETNGQCRHPYTNGQCVLYIAKQGKGRYFYNALMYTLAWDHACLMFNDKTTSLWWLLLGL